MTPEELRAHIDKTNQERQDAGYRVRFERWRGGNNEFVTVPPQDLTRPTDNDKPGIPLQEAIELAQNLASADPKAQDIYVMDHTGHKVYPQHGYLNERRRRYGYGW